MKTFPLSACLAIVALILAAGCSKSTDRAEAAKQKEASAPAEPSAAVEAAAAEPEVAAEEVAAEENAEVDPAARLAGPADEERELVAIGADKTRIIPLGKKTLSETAEYTLELALPDDVAKGAGGKVEVKLSPKKGWKLNREFPTKLTVRPPSDVEVAKKNQGVDDAVSFSEKKGATWAVEFKSASAGEKEFSGKFKFAVCTETTCDPKFEKLAFAVQVK